MSWIYSGVIVIPARTSVFIAMDYYQRGVPLFVPSKRWTENFVAKCGLDEAVRPEQQLGKTDSRNWRANIDTKEWLSWPHVIVFEDWDDLLEKLDHVDTWAIHDMMTTALAAQRLAIVETWRGIFDGARSFSRGSTQDIFKT